MEKQLPVYPNAVVRIRFYSALHADYAVELSVFLPAEEESRIGNLIAGVSKPEGVGFRHLILDKKFSPNGNAKTISLEELTKEVERIVDTP